MEITPSNGPCGAEVRGIDLRDPLSPSAVDQIRRAWLDHHVLSFPDQALSDDDLERFTLYFGPFGDDPFIAPIPGREHVIAVHRRAEERGSIFAESWHTDWSFLETPPAGTCLYGKIIPPSGGETLFADQHLALERMPDDLRRRLEGRRAVHSARVAYSPTGLYGEHDDARAMDIRPSDEATATQTHPIIRRHPETGREGLYGCIGYIVGVEDMDPAEAMALLAELYQWQTRDDFQYCHEWSAGMLVMWDNRSVLHKATGGYEGRERLLHRTTIGER